MPIYARAYLELANGTYLYSDTVVDTLQSVVESVDEKHDSLTDVQKTAINTMYAAFRETMDRWQIPNLKQANS